MPYYLDQSIGSDFNTLQDFTPTGGQAFRAQVGEAWESNPSVLGMEAFRVARANANGERLSAYDAGKIATEAGLREFAPGDGQYTREALDIVLERKREQRQRQDVIARTPWSMTGTPLRGAGMLGAALLDPLNVASAFVPVIAPARYTALVAGAAGAGGRAAVRAGVGAVEGTVGMALLEPAIYGARQYLDDDYGMQESLLNIAFGGLLGGGLHVVGGGVADALSPGKWAAVRTLDDAIAQADLPRPRTDAGMPAPGSAADVAARSSPEARYDALRTAVAHMADGRAVQVDALLAERATVEGLAYTPAEARAQAVADLRDEMRAELLPEAALESDRGAIAPLKAEREQAAAALERVGAKYRERVKALQDRDGIKRAEAEKRVTKADDEARASAEATLARLDQQLDANSRGNRAAQDLAAIERGEVPERFAERVQAEVDKVMRSGERQPLAAAMEGMFGGQRGARLLLNAESTPSALRAAAERQSAPESSITADFNASRAADERLAAAPKREDVTAATEMADAAFERYTRARADAEAAGVPPAKLKAMDDAMAEADEIVKDAENLGRAVEAAATCGARVN